MVDIILTSTGLSGQASATFFIDLIKKYNFKSVAIIANANIEGMNGRYVLVAKQQLEDLGLSVTFVDPLNSSFQGDMANIDVLYIAGGNTFNLLDDIRNGIGFELFKKTLLTLKVIIGVSAGSIILTPTIRIAATIEPDDNPRQVTDFDALNLVKDEFLPHFEPLLEKEVINYEQTYNVSVIRSENGSFTHYHV